MKLTLPAHALSVCRAADAEIERYALGCVQFGIHKHMAFAAASDGRRLHVAEWESDGHDCDFLVPGAAVKAAMGADARMLTYAATQWSFPFGEWEIAGQQVEGKFPNWRELADRYSARKGRKIRLDVNYLADAVGITGKRNGPWNVDLFVAAKDAHESPLFVKQSNGPYRAWVMPIKQEPE